MPKISLSIYFFTKLKKNDKAQKLNYVSSYKTFWIISLHKLRILLKGTRDDLIADYKSFKNLFEFLCLNSD